MPRDAHFSFSRGDWWVWLTEWLILMRPLARTNAVPKTQIFPSSAGDESDHRFVRISSIIYFPEWSSDYMTNWALQIELWSLSYRSKCKHHILYLKKCNFVWVLILGNFRCVLNLWKQYSQYGSQFLEFSITFRSLTSWIMFDTDTYEITARANQPN